MFFGPFGLFYSTVTFGIIVSVVFVIGAVILVPSAVHELLTHFRDSMISADLIEFFDMFKGYDYFNGPVFYLIVFYTIITVVSLGLWIYYVYLHNKNTYGLALSLHEYGNIVRGLDKANNKDNVEHINN